MSTVRLIFNDPVAKHMRTDPTRLKLGQTVSQAIESIRDHPLCGRVLYFYVVDDDDVLKGVIATRQLCRNRPDLALSSEDVPPRSASRIRADRLGGQRHGDSPAVL